MPGEDKKPEAAAVKKPEAASSVPGKGVVTEMKLKKPMRYGGAVRAVGYPVILSDKKRAKLAVKGYV